ncbi:MAG TPA: D-tyrosyl-tRNA(Tyr) deacylase [Treponema sp.]|nr:D-tyrosyl-tRNA(Tyr) deacylase [Treponema sp.]
MRVVLQRVSKASVTVDGTVCGAIGTGYLVLLGITGTDTRELAAKMVDKIARLRIFEDEHGKTNKSISDAGGSLLVVSQFTLYADCSRGNRPGFEQAARPELAEPLYEYFLERAAACDAFRTVQHGIFGADMKVALENDGPFTLVLEMHAAS